MLEIIKTRRSVRKFSSRPVSDAAVEDILEAARWAPSGKNRQPWKFAVVRDSKVKKAISKCTDSGKIIRAADVLISVFLDTSVSCNRTKDVQAAGACIQNMLLAAHALGFGAVWLGEILKNSQEVAEILQAPGESELMAVIAMGYPARRGSPRPPPRKPLSELVFFRR